MEAYESKNVVKATTLINDTPYTIWFTITQKSTGRVRVQFLQEQATFYAKPYMLLQLVNTILKELSVPLPPGLAQAKVKMLQDRYGTNYRVLSVHNIWYKMDRAVDGTWINNPGLLSMVKFVRDKRPHFEQKTIWEFNIQPLL